MKEIFDNYKNIAVYGMSKNESKTAYSVPAYILSQGYNVIPVNPTATEIAGKKCYPNLDEIPDEIDVLNVFRPSEDCLAVVEGAVARKNKRGDIKLIWLQEGIVNSQAQKLALENDIEFIQDKCIYKEYINR